MSLSAAGAAHQHLALRRVLPREDAGLVDARVDLAVKHRALAHAAAAVAAFVGQVDPAAQAGVEDGLAGRAPCTVRLSGCTLMWNSIALWLPRRLGGSQGSR
jgi:hypothetical protein